MTGPVSAPVACDRRPGVKPNPEATARAEARRKAAAAHDAEIKRAGAMLSAHSARTALDMADGKASPELLAQMLSNLAAAHRAAANNLDAAALQARLRLPKAKP